MVSVKVKQSFKVKAGFKHETYICPQRKMKYRNVWSLMGRPI